MANPRYRVCRRATIASGILANPILVVVSYMDKLRLLETSIEGYLVDSDGTAAGIAAPDEIVGLPSDVASATGYLGEPLFMLTDPGMQGQMRIYQSKNHLLCLISGGIRGSTANAMQYLAHSTFEVTPG